MRAKLADMNVRNFYPFGLFWGFAFVIWRRRVVFCEILDSIADSVGLVLFDVTALA